MYGNNKLNIGGVLLIIIVSYGFQCNKKLGCAGTVYNFEFAIKAFPDFENIKVGDSLWFKIDHSTKMVDIGSGKEVDWSGASNLTTVLYFHQLSNSNEFSIEAADKLNYILVDGKEVENSASKRLKEIRFNEEDNQYKLLIGLVPQEKGIFRLAFSNAANVY